jgi:hypothetical protein
VAVPPCVTWTAGELHGDEDLVWRVQHDAWLHDGYALRYWFCPSTYTAHDHLAVATNAYVLMDAPF